MTITGDGRRWHIARSVDGAAPGNTIQAREVLLPRLSSRLARSQLAEPRSRRSDAQRRAFLAEARWRRISGECALASDQGRRISRQSAQPALARGHGSLRSADSDIPIDPKHTT